MGFSLIKTINFQTHPDLHFHPPIGSRLRAVLAAARFCDTLAEEGLEGRSGVATGTVWCGAGPRAPTPTRRKVVHWEKTMWFFVGENVVN